MLRTIDAWRKISPVPRRRTTATTRTTVRIAVAAILALALLLAPPSLLAQTSRGAQRVGVIQMTGHHHVVVDGLRQGLRDLGLEDGKQYVMDIRTISEDLKGAEEAARALERAKVDVIYTVTSQMTLAAKRVTARTPIVFYVGVDPVGIGLVESLPKPGGRLTGVHGLSRDVTPKRMALLKEMLPKIRRVITFSTPGDTVSQDNARTSRDAARQLGIQVVERPVRSFEELRRRLQDLKPREADAYFSTPGVLATSQAPLIIEAARARKLPTMFHEQSLVSQGALASYGSSYYEIGRVSAKHVARILTGSHPWDLPVENYDKVGLALNLRVARELGLTMPPSLILQADHKVE